MIMGIKYGVTRIQDRSGGYDQEELAWTPQDSMPQPVAHATHAVLRTKLHGPPAIVPRIKKEVENGFFPGDVWKPYIFLQYHYYYLSIY